MAVLSVGAGQTYGTLSAAVVDAQDGDVIQLQPGLYVDDFATITKQITIEGVGPGRAHLQADSPPPNGKAILVTNGNITLRNLEFSGAAVADGNGAGIRYEGGNLTIDNCYFHDNQDGMLAADSPAGSITITNSEFDHNGTGDGQTHNLYVNQVGTLTITDSYFHDAVIGHEIKSRALNTIVQGSTIVDGADGTASYSIDLPNGGNAIISDVFIEQGPNSDNPAIIHFGGESEPYPGSSLSINDNIIRNDLPSGSAVAVLNHTTLTVSFVGNDVYGLNSGQIASGPVSESGTTFLDTPPPIPCFLAGTLIATDEGEIPIEHLRIGARVVVHFGALPAEVIWLGHRRVDCRRHKTPLAVWPVRVAAGALGPDQPRRDLWLSPEHAVFVNDVLIPVRLLVNGSTVIQVRVDEVTYHHVELARHNVVLAEGLPVESYLDTGNRANFAGGRLVMLHPDFGWRQWEALGCAPLVVTGQPLAQARATIAAIAATNVQQQPRKRPLPTA
ncbi:MAG: Hint domain-containing protein [Acetobacteraceae bacterium]